MAKEEKTAEAPDPMEVAQAVIDWREANQHRRDIGPDHLEREIARLEDYLAHNQHPEKAEKYEAALAQRKLVREGLKLFKVGG